MVMAGCVCPNRESDGPVCSAETTQTLCLLSGKDPTSLQFPPLKCAFPKHNGIILTVQTDHKEKVQQQTNLREPETKPGGHEDTLHTEWSHKTIDASVCIE